MGLYAGAAGKAEEVQGGSHAWSPGIRSAPSRPHTLGPKGAEQILLGGLSVVPGRVV